MFHMKIIILALFLVQCFLGENDLNKTSGNCDNHVSLVGRSQRPKPQTNSTLLRTMYETLGLIPDLRNLATMEKHKSSFLNYSDLLAEFGKHRSKRNSFDFALPLHPGVNVSTPNNMSFKEMLFYWESLVCPGNTFCEEQADYRQSGVECSPFICHSCSCNNYTNCDKQKGCCVDHSIAARENPINKLDYINCATGSSAVDSSQDTALIWYYFVNKCPANFTDYEFIQGCELNEPFKSFADIQMDLPVYSVDQRLHYFNSYCAQCHGVVGSTITWIPEVRCSDYFDVRGYRSQTDLIKDIIKSKGCFVTSLPPTGTEPFICESSETVIRGCNVSGEWTLYDHDIEAACNMYFHKIKIFDNWNSNVFCGFCNGVSQDEIIEHFRRGYACSSESFSGIAGLSFSAIFKFQKEPKSSINHSENHMTECPIQDVYDPYLNTCRPLECSKGRYISNHSCVDIYKTSTGIGYSITFSLIPTVYPFELFESPESLREPFLNSFIHHEVYINLFPVHLMITMEICGISPAYSALYVHVVAGIKINLQVIVGPSLYPEEVEKTLLKLYNSTIEFYGTNWTTRDNQPRPFNASDKRIWCESHSATHKDIGFTLPIEYALSTDAYIEVNKLTRCNQIQLNRNEYTIDRNTGDIELVWTKERRGSSDYHIVNGTARICVNYSGWYQTEERGNPENDDQVELEGLLTLVCLSLSLFALVLTFIVCLLMKTNKTIPGLITIILITLIFVAQLLFLISGYAVENLWVCRVIGLTIHFFWLTVFAWKNIAAYHMYAVFTRPLDHAHDSHTKTILKYSTYGFGTPAILVGSYVCARTILSHTTSIGYGTDELCFLPRPIDVGLAFALPVGLVLLSNIYLFGRVIHVIRQMSEIDKHTNQTNATHNALFVKMSVILGFTWIVGFIANTISQPSVWYTFIILNGGSGVLIFISQVCNQSVVNRLRGTFKDWSSERST